MYGILSLPKGFCNHNTFSRLLRNLIFCSLDPEPYHASSQRVITRSSEQSQDVVAVDGNGLRAAFDRAPSRSVPHQVSALDREGGPVRSRTGTDAKSIENDIPLSSTNQN